MVRFHVPSYSVLVALKLLLYYNPIVKFQDCFFLKYNVKALSLKIKVHQRMHQSEDSTEIHPSPCLGHLVLVQYLPTIHTSHQSLEQMH